MRAELRMLLEVEEVLEREVKRTGNGAHVTLPSRWIGKKVKIIRLKE